jgi:hypothetical protein
MCQLHVCSRAEVKSRNWVFHIAGYKSYKVEGQGFDWVRVRFVTVLGGFGVRCITWYFSFRGSLYVGGCVRVSAHYVSGADTDQSHYSSREVCE